MKARLPQGMGKGPSNNMNRMLKQAQIPGRNAGQHEQSDEAGSENAGRDHSSSGRP